MTTAGTLKTIYQMKMSLKNELYVQRHENMNELNKVSDKFNDFFFLNFKNFCASIFVSAKSKTTS